MSRVAEAYEHAGYTLRGDDVTRWEVERRAAEAHLAGTTPAPAHAETVAASPAHQPFEAPVRHSEAGADVRAPVADASQTSVHGLPAVRRPHAGEETTYDGPRTPRVRPPATAARTETTPAFDSADDELAAAVRRIFLSPRSRVRSVLFCTVPGDATTDAAWQAAELLVAQTGRRVAFVEDGAKSTGRRSRSTPDLITRIGWYPADSQQAASPHGKSSLAHGGGSLGEDVLARNVADLSARFDFVVLNATASSADDLVPLAAEVDGVIVVVTANETRRDEAERLVSTLRSGGVHILGALLTTAASARGDHLFNFDG